MVWFGAKLVNIKEVVDLIMKSFFHPTKSLSLVDKMTFTKLF